MVHKNRMSKQYHRGGGTKKEMFELCTLRNTDEVLMKDEKRESKLLIDGLKDY